MSDETAAPIFSALDVHAFTQKGCPRTYLLAPLNYRQRQAMQRVIRRTAGPAIDNAIFLDVLRQAIREIAPANLDQCLEDIDLAEAAPADPIAQAKLSVLEHAVAGASNYGEMREAMARHEETKRWETIRHCLRGWSGPGLGTFVAVDGVATDAMLESIPAGEFDAIYSQASALVWLGPSAVGNSEAPSPSPDPQTTTPAA